LAAGLARPLSRTSLISREPQPGLRGCCAGCITCRPQALLGGAGDSAFVTARRRSPVIGGSFETSFGWVYDFQSWTKIVGPALENGRFGVRIL